MEEVFLLFLIAALLLAAVSAADWLSARAVSRPIDAACVTVLPLTGECERLEAALRWALFSLHRDYGGYASLFLVDAGASQEALAIARAFCREHDGVMLTTTENLRAILGDAVYKTVQLVLY